MTLQIYFKLCSLIPHYIPFHVSIGQHEDQ